MKIQLINNEELTLDMLPADDDFSAVARFALSFNGYEHYGSFEACAEQARSNNRSDLSSIRNELFFTQRGLRYLSTNEDVFDAMLAKYKELKPLIVKFLERT